MTRTPSDACFFVGLMAVATAVGAWLYDDSTWFLGGLLVAVIATVAWATTHRHENKPIPYTTTIRYDINQLFQAQNDAWEQRGTRTWTHHTDNPYWPTMTPHQADTNWPGDERPVWPHELGAPE